MKYIELPFLIVLGVPSFVVGYLCGVIYNGFRSGAKVAGQ